MADPKSISGLADRIAVLLDTARELVTRIVSDSVSTSTVDDITLHAAQVVLDRAISECSLLVAELRELQP